LGGRIRTSSSSTSSLSHEMFSRFFFLPQCVCDYAESKRSLIFVPIM
jgi:hypothetical protein